MWPSNQRYRGILGLLFVFWWAALAVHPWHRSDWLLENVLAFLAIAVLFAFRHKLVLSRISYTLIFIFLCLHELGAHYSYSEVPYDSWWKHLTGHSLNGALGWQRNNFDRVVHFSYGLLLAYPIREMFLRVANVRGFWGYFLPLDLTMSTSMLYELIEWRVSIFFGGQLGQDYLATQGDIWDSQEDMAMASLGALICMGITAAINWRLQRDFAQEIAESLRVKHKTPLGEVAIARALAQKDSGAQGDTAKG